MIFLIVNNYYNYSRRNHDMISFQGAEMLLADSLVLL